jgi:hypothetical protein
MDNLNQVRDKIDDALPLNGGLDSVKVSKHNPLEKTIIETVGKYTGFQFFAKRSIVNARIEAGYMFWNGYAMNRNTSFNITCSEYTRDGNRLDRILELISGGDLIHFKDFGGNSTTLKYKGHERKTDAEGRGYYNIFVIGFAENTDYSYQAADQNICFLEFITQSGSAGQPEPTTKSAGAYFFKSKGWDSEGQPLTGVPGEKGDFYEGTPSPEVYAGTAKYMGDINGGGVDNVDNFEIIHYIPLT